MTQPLKNIIFTIQLTGFLLVMSTMAWAQKQGCTDPKAKNYNPLAVINDGNCEYPMTLFTPDLKAYLPKEVEETSGLAYFKGGLWTMNDSGGKPVLYKIDTTTGKVLQRITIKNATNKDWEDLAVDDKYIYIGDFGNNSGNRNDLKIYRIRLADIPSEGDTAVNAKIISFKFEDRGTKKIQGRKYNNFDCEAFTVAGDSLLLFSKNWENQKTRIYILPKKPGDYTARLIDSMDVSGLVTGADYNAADKELILVGYKNKSWIPFLWIISDFDGHDFMRTNKRRINMPKIITTQTEGITYTHGKNVMITSEATKIGKQSLYTLNTGKWTTTLPDESLTEAGNNLISRVERHSKSRIYLYLKNAPDGEYQVQLYDLAGNNIPIKKVKLKKDKQHVILSVKTKKLPGGKYFVKLTAGNKQSVKTFPVKND